MGGNDHPLRRITDPTRRITIPLRGMTSPSVGITIPAHPWSHPSSRIKAPMERIGPEKRSGGFLVDWNVAISGWLRRPLELEKRRSKERR